MPKHCCFNLQAHSSHIHLALHPDVITMNWLSQSSVGSGALANGAAQIPSSTRSFSVGAGGLRRLDKRILSSARLNGSRRAESFHGYNLSSSGVSALSSGLNVLNRFDAPSELEFRCGLQAHKRRYVRFERYFWNVCITKCTKCVKPQQQTFVF